MAQRSSAKVPDKGMPSLAWCQRADTIKLAQMRSTPFEWAAAERCSSVGMALAWMAANLAWQAKHICGSPVLSRASPHPEGSLAGKLERQLEEVNCRRRILSSQGLDTSFNGCL